MMVVVVLVVVMIVVLVMVMTRATEFLHRCQILSQGLLQHCGFFPGRGDMRRLCSNPRAVLTLRLTNLLICRFRRPVQPIHVGRNTPVSGTDFNGGAARSVASRSVATSCATTKLVLPATVVQLFESKRFIYGMSLRSGLFMWIHPARGQISDERRVLSNIQQEILYLSGVNNNKNNKTTTDVIRYLFTP